MRLAALLLCVAGCKDPRPRQAVAEDAASAAPGTHVRLPSRPAAQRTCAATPAVIARLAAIEHADFDREDRGSDTTLRVRHTTKARPKLGVTIELGACGDRCPGLDDREAMPAALRGLPGTRLERGVRDDARLAALGRVQTQYALGATEGGPREQGLPDRADADGRRTYLDAYTLYADDGTTWLRVTASYLDDAVGGGDQLLAIAPPEDLEKLATAFAGFYLYECSVRA